METNMNMIEVSRRDLIVILKAMLDPEFFTSYVGGDYSRHDYDCMHCLDWTDLHPTHSQDCPVLLAQDMSTGLIDLEEAN